MYDVKCGKHKFLLYVPPLIRWLLCRIIVKILVGHIIIFSNVPVAVIRFAVGNICSMRIPKINGDEIVFEPVFIGITESVTKNNFAAYAKIIERAGF